MNCVFSFLAPFELDSGYLKLISILKAITSDLKILNKNNYTRKNVL